MPVSHPKIEVKKKPTDLRLLCFRLEVRLKTACSESGPKPPSPYLRAVAEDVLNPGLGDLLATLHIELAGSEDGDVADADHLFGNPERRHAFVE